MSNPIANVARKLTIEPRPPAKPKPKASLFYDPTNGEPNWRDDANCLGKGEKMFPQGYKDISYISEARAICRACPVREPCMDYALSFPITDMQGVWCGLTPRQLAAEQKKRGIVPTKPTIAQLWAEFAKSDDAG